MVLAASRCVHIIIPYRYTHCISFTCSDSKVELLDPPSDSKPGEIVLVEGYEREKCGGLWMYLTMIKFYTKIINIVLAPDEQINPKKKIFEQIQVS